MSQILYQLTEKNDVWTEINNVCRLRRQDCQNATRLTVLAGTKQIYKQVLRFGGQR